MKCIIAGGRNYQPNENDGELCRKIITHYKITEIISEGASGADAFGEKVEIVDTELLTDPGDCSDVEIKQIKEALNII